MAAGAPLSFGRTVSRGLGLLRGHGLALLQVSLLCAVVLILALAPLLQLLLYTAWPTLGMGVLALCVAAAVAVHSLAVLVLAGSTTLVASVSHQSLAASGVGGDGTAPASLSLSAVLKRLAARCWKSPLTLAVVVLFFWAWCHPYVALVPPFFFSFAVFLFSGGALNFFTAMVHLGLLVWLVGFFAALSTFGLSFTVALLDHQSSLWQTLKRSALLSRGRRLRLFGYYSALFLACIPIIIVLTVSASVIWEMTVGLRNQTDAFIFALAASGTLALAVGPFSAVLVAEYHQAVQAEVRSSGDKLEAKELLEL